MGKIQFFTEFMDLGPFRAKQEKRAQNRTFCESRIMLESASTLNSVK